MSIPGPVPVPAQRMQAPVKTWRQPSGKKLWSQSLVTFVTYLKPAPTDYIYQSVQPPDEVLRARQAAYRQATFDGDNARRPQNSKRPNTREYYDSKNAADKPVDGPDAKLEGDGAQCLTCINQGPTCHGTEVVGGKCRSCRGDNKDGKRTRQIRICRWREPENNIFTYSDHKAAYPRGRISVKPSQDSSDDSSDSSDDDSEHQAGSDDQNGDGSSDALASFVTIHDVVDPYAKQVVQAMVATVLDGGWASNDAEANSRALLSLAQECSERPEFDVAESKDVMEEVLDILSNMTLLNHFVSYQAMTDSLPSAHPAYTGSDQQQQFEQPVADTEEAVENGAENENAEHKKELVLLGLSDEDAEWEVDDQV